MERDYAYAVDALQEDMAGHQRRTGAEVTAGSNQRLAADAIERLEKEDADCRPGVAPSTADVSSVQKREINGHTYTIDKSVAPERPYRTATDFEANVLRHAMPRIAHLLSLRDEGPLGAPSWRTRTMAALYFKVKSLEALQSGKTDLVEYYERAYQLDLHELLEASNQPFGDWRRTPDKPLVVSV